MSKKQIPVLFESQNSSETHKADLSIGLMGETDK